jgi:hypothetical protein
VSLLLVHLFHADAQDKYHACIRNDMMLMMNGKQYIFNKNITGHSFTD